MDQRAAKKRKGAVIMSDEEIPPRAEFDAMITRWEGLIDADRDRRRKL